MDPPPESEVGSSGTATEAASVIRKHQLVLSVAVLRGSSAALCTWYCIARTKPQLHCARYCFTLSNKDARSRVLYALIRTVSCRPLFPDFSWLHLTRRRCCWPVCCCCPLRPPVARFRFLPCFPCAATVVRKGQPGNGGTVNWPRAGLEVGGDDGAFTTDDGRNMRH
jgi:hypothetical protein